MSNDARAKEEADVGTLAFCSTFLTHFAVITRLAGARPVPRVAFQRLLFHAPTLLRAASAEGPPGTGCSQMKRNH